MFNITPDMARVIESLETAIPFSKFSNTVNIFTGRMSVSTYCSVFGGPATDIAGGSLSHPGIPDDHIVISVSKSGSSTSPFAVSDDGTYVDGLLNRAPTRFRVLNIGEMFARGESIIRIPHLSVIIGLKRSEVESYDSLEINVDLADLGSNLIGSVVVPVVNTVEESTEYFINSFGRTFTIPTQTSAQTGQPAGLYTWGGGDRFTYVGTIDDAIFVDANSLKREIVLYHSKKDASRYVTAKSVYESLDSAAKALASDRERDLVTMKSETTKLDNDSKVKTIEAKSNYEVSSAGRKNSQEEVSFGRNLTIGLLASATAAIGVMAKMGFVPSYGMGLTSASIISLTSLVSAVAASPTLLTGLLASIPTIAIAAGVTLGAVYVVRKICSAVASGVRRIFRRFTL